MRKPTFSNIKTCLECLVEHKEDKKIFEITQIKDRVVLLQSPVHRPKLATIKELKKEYVLMID